MQMLASVLEGLFRTIDLLLGWLLLLPRDLALFIFAAGTALTVTLIRRRVTNQDLLHRCTADLILLRLRIRGAKVAGDKPLLTRLRTTVGQVKGMQLVADLRVLLYALLPVAILATWASERFDYLPPKVGEKLLVRAWFPESSIDRVAHIVPVPSLELQSPAIQIVTADTQAPPIGAAEWIVVPTAAGQFDLTIRHLQESAVHRVDVGRVTYGAPLLHHPGERLPRTEVVLRRYFPLGSHLGSLWHGLPPWMIGYVVLMLLLTPLFKRLLHIA